MCLVVVFFNYRQKDSFIAVVVQSLSHARLCDRTDCSMPGFSLCVTAAQAIIPAAQAIIPAAQVIYLQLR